MNKKIIWCGNAYYGSSLKVGCNYYSELLAKQDNKILFIAPPVSPFHNKKENKIRLKQASKGLTEVTKNYFIYTPYSYFPPIKKLSLILYGSILTWHIFTKPNLKKEIAGNEFLEVDILVIDYFAFLPLVKTIKYNQLIVRITDNLRGFGLSKAAINAERQLIKKAHKVIYTSSKLENEIKPLNKNCMYIPNGVDFNKFQGVFSKPQIFNTMKNQVAVYIGAIENWFDFKLLDYISGELQNIHFLIIGAVKYKPSIFKKIEAKANVTFYGMIENQLVPNYLKYSKLGIIPFRRELELVQSISPLKLYEYMAAGLPVVATKWDELEHIKSPAYLASSKEDFVKFLNIALCDDKKKYKEFARLNDWSQKLKHIC